MEGLVQIMLSCNILSFPHRTLQTEKGCNLKTYQPSISETERLLAMEAELAASIRVFVALSFIYKFTFVIVHVASVDTSKQDR